MQSVKLSAGRYWVGRPDLLFSDWTPHEVGSMYVIYNSVYYAFRFGQVHVAAIQDYLIEDVAHAKTVGSFVKFDTTVDFSCHNGSGFIGGINLGSLGAESEQLDTGMLPPMVDDDTPHHSADYLADLKDEVLSHLPHVTGGDNPIDFPKKKKASKTSTV